MKRSDHIFLILLLISIVTGCEKEQRLVTYPESYPVFAKVNVEETDIVYGDSITLHAEIKDRITPLSTLEVQIVVNNELVKKESIRTKGNQDTVIRKYKIPFVARRPENALVKVYLSSINVDGYTTDTILSTCRAHRPVISNLWLVPKTGKTYKMTLTDSANYIYHVEGMSFGTTITYYLATKIDKFSKVDWSGLVFGKVNDGIGLIDASGEPLTNTDLTLVGISTLTFDAYNFTVEVGGKLLEPVTTLDINADLSPMTIASKAFRGGNVYFGEGTEVTFINLTDLTNSLPPDYFEITGPNTAKFVGSTAIYKAYYYIDGNYLYVEPQPDVVYPDAMWVCGTGFGRPAPPYEVTSSWNWNTPFDYAPCRRVSPGVYQLTIYGKNTEGSNGYGTLDFKFFFQRGWGQAPLTEIDAAQYTLTPPFFGRTDPGNTGNVNGGSTSFEGVFKITLNQNNKTITLEKIR